MTKRDRSPADYGTEFWWHFTDVAEEDEPYLLPTSLMKYFERIEIDAAAPGQGRAVFDTAEEAEAALAEAMRRSGCQSEYHK